LEIQKFEKERKLNKDKLTLSKSYMCLKWWSITIFLLFLSTYTLQSRCYASILPYNNFATHQPPVPIMQTEIYSPIIDWNSQMYRRGLFEEKINQTVFKLRHRVYNRGWETISCQRIYRGSGFWNDHSSRDVRFESVRMQLGLIANIRFRRMCWSAWFDSLQIIEYQALLWI
jgi:hypothetical protein